MFKEVKVVRNELKQIAPGMQFTVSLSGSRRRGNYETVVLKYNAEIAAEHGITKPALRAATLHGLGTLDHTTVFRVSLKPYVPYTPPVNNDKVIKFLDELQPSLKTFEGRLTTQRLLKIVAENVDRKEKAFFQEVLKNI